MYYRPWQINRPNKQTSAECSAKTGLPPLVCNVLQARNKTTVSEINALINNEMQSIDPMEMHGMSQAVSRILHAVDNNERIVVFGDYDVDGVTATALLYSYLDSIGAEVYYKLPNREDDGYGLSIDAVEQLAAKKVKLIITVDNGISANEAIARANELSIDVVVTDHHLPPKILPEAVAIVDPQILSEGENHCTILCGAGVAFMLVCALEGCSVDEMLPFYGDFAAIGTVADIMVLEGINRKIVKAGLVALQETQRPGLAALIESCGLAEKEITAENISFGLSPRLNAAGRMDSATAALELLLCEDPEEAFEQVKALEEQNTARQKAEQDIAKAVLDEIAKDKRYEQERIIIVAGEGFHAGVIGIVASRIVDKFGKPAIIISIDENGEGKGSGRSIEGFSLYNAIAACSNLLIRYGGHALAAGLSVEKDKIKELRTQINQWAAEQQTTFEHNPLRVDTPVQMDRVTIDDVAALSVLAPFGHGNPSPLFLVEKAVVDAIYPVSDGKHCRIRLKQGAIALYAVLFGQRPEALCYEIGSEVDAVVSFSVYEGKNGPMLSGRIRELRPTGLNENYLQGTQLYEALCCNAPLTQSQKEQLLPQRQDTVDVYRQIQKGIKANDLRPLFASLGTQRSAKILVSIKALIELGLAQQTDTDGAIFIKAVENAPKRNLSDAPVLHYLGGS